MALSQKITLPNGVELNYHKVSNIEVNKESIKVKVHSFISKDTYNKSQQKSKMIEEQEKLVKEFDELNSKDKLTKAQTTKVNKLVEQINDLANDISNQLEYIQFVIVETIIEIPFIENFSCSNIEKELLKTEQFKVAKIVS